MDFTRRMLKTITFEIIDSFNPEGFDDFNAISHGLSVERMSLSAAEKEMLSVMEVDADEDDGEYSHIREVRHCIKHSVDKAIRVYAREILRAMNEYEIYDGVTCFMLEKIRVDCLYLRAYRKPAE